MIILSGKLLQVYSTPTGTDKEGKSYGGDTKIQILNETRLRNGETKNEIIEMIVSEVYKYKDQLNENIEVQVNVRAYKNSIYFEAV